MQHIDGLSLQCRGFEREYHKEYQEFVAFVNENLKLNRENLEYTGEYVYTCIALLYAFSRTSASLKTDIENLLAHYENIAAEPAPASEPKINSKEWFYTTTSHDEEHGINHQTSYADQPAMQEEHIDKKKPEIITANNSTPLVIEEPTHGKKSKLIIKSVDDIIAIMCALKETKGIYTDDDGTEPTSKQLAEIIYTSFKVKKEKGEGFYPFDTLERYFGLKNDESSKSSKFEKRKKEFLKALQSGK